MLLYPYYGFYEIIDIKEVLLCLESLKNDGKIKYHLDGDILKLEDLDLDECDIVKIAEVFDRNDVFPYLERDDDDEIDPFDDFYDDFNDFDY